jgi:hypothetical protein
MPIMSMLWDRGWISFYTYMMYLQWFKNSIYEGSFYHRPSMYKVIDMLKSNNESVPNVFIYLSNMKNDLLNSYL